MSLAMGLSALDEFYREGDRRELRDRDRKRFGWESQRSEAEMSLLGDKTAAERLGYQDRAGEFGARMATRPQRTANEITRLGNEGYSLERAGARRGTVEDTADVVANYSLADAKFKFGQQPTVQQTTANTNEVGLQNSAQALESNPARLETNTNQTIMGLNQSRADLAQQPMKIAQQAAQGVITQMQAQSQIVGGILDAMQTGNQDIVRGYLQGAINTGLFPKVVGRKVSEIGSTKDASGQPVLIAKDENGGIVLQVSMAELQRVRSAMAKPETMKINEGESVVQVRDGKVTTLYTAPTSPGKAAERMGPLERDVGYLMKFHGKTKDQALAFVNSSKTMSREQFVLKSITDSVALGKKPNDAEVAEFGAIYDRATQGGPRAAPAAPRTPGQPGMDPALKKLLGIP